MIRRLLGWLRSPTSDLLAPPVRCQIVIAYDAEYRWSLLWPIQTYTPQERIAIVQGMLNATHALAERYGCKIGPPPQEQTP